LNLLADPKMMIQPQGPVSSLVKVMIWLPAASVARGLDARIARSVDASVAGFLSLIEENSVPIPAMSPIPKLLAGVRGSRGLSGYQLDDLRRFHDTGAEWVCRNTFDPHRQHILKAWDGVYVLCNIAADVNRLMLCRRMAHACRTTVCFIEGPPAEAPEAIATFETSGQGAIATAAGMPYVHNIWSSRSGVGTELLRFIRDHSHSASLLVKPLSEKLAQYYRERHCGIPWLEGRFHGGMRAEERRISHV
jgi:hypothetical protein